MKGKNQIVLFVIIMILSSLYEDIYASLNLELMGPTYAKRPSDVDQTRVTSATGLGLAVGIDLVNSRDVTLQLRGDISYYDFSRTSSSSQVMFPTFFGFRVLLGDPSLTPWFLPFMESGYEIRFKSNFNNQDGQDHGFVLGGGSEFYLTEEVYFGIHFRYHVFRSSFISIGPIIGYRFN